MEIVNLDSIVPEHTKVIVGGMELIVPGNSSVEYSFRQIKYAQILQTNPTDFETMEAAFDNLVEELKPLNPSLDKDTFRKRISVLQYTQIISMLYGNKVNVEDYEKKTIPAAELKEEPKESQQ